jgi:hypothetical protein
MNYTVLYQRIHEPGFPPDMFYAHIPTLDLTTHGIGVEGARIAAHDLVELWVAEKKANGEDIPTEEEVLTGQISISDAIYSA